jgi:hypothetical protein
MGQNLPAEFKPAFGRPPRVVGKKVAINISI